MGLFNYPKRSAVGLDSEASERRRNLLAAAIDSARNPEPVKSRRTMPANGLSARSLFASGDVGRLTGDWPTAPVPADWIISRYQRTLVARSREQANNNDYMKSYLRLQRINIVGPTGIMFQSQARDSKGEPDMVARAAINAWWAKWGKRENCDITGKLSWRAMQSALVESAARDGEFFVRFIFGTVAGPMRFSLQVVDGQRCPVEMNRDDLNEGSFVRQGIEFNRYGKPVAYYFAEPSAERNAMGYTFNGRAYVRVPADEVIHGFIQEMPGQKRGLPWMSTGLFRAKQTSAMEDAAVVNARVGAAKMGFIEFTEGKGPEFDEDDELEIDAEAGTFPVLPDGAKLSTFDPLYPSGELVPFVKLMLRGFSSGGGVSYHSLSGDLTDVNFSSIRHGTLDERETYKERQEWLREELCDRVMDVALPRALLSGLVVTDAGTALHADKLPLYVLRKWQPRRWQWIDPSADVDAAESWKNNLLVSPSDQIREQGREPEEVWKQTGEDIAQMRANGIPESVIAASFGQKPAAAPTTPKGEDSK